MKRFHVHVSADDLNRAVRFYSTLFAAAPNVLKPDYAKWMIDDPRVSFAISMRGHRKGLDHLGIQVEDTAELAEVYDRLKQAQLPILEQEATTCCYAQSDKAWVTDPQGIAWEAFLTHGESPVYSESLANDEPPATGACCTEPTPRADANAAFCGCNVG